MYFLLTSTDELVFRDSFRRIFQSKEYCYMMQLSAVNSKPYHDCRRLNRNGTRKLIHWKRGERSLIPTNARCWRPTKEKYLRKKYYQTTYRKRLKTKKNNKKKEIKDIFEKHIMKVVYDTPSEGF